MIDTKLIKEAVQTSERILAVDDSWRKFLKETKKNILVLPFSGDHTFIFKNKKVLVEVFCGKLRIDKLCFNRKMFSLKTPIIQEEYKLYGQYDTRGNFDHLTSKPNIGFHYMGNPLREGRYICHGNNKIDSSSFELLKVSAEQLIDSFHVINAESLGVTILPEEHSVISKIFIDKRDPRAGLVECLLEKKLISQIL